MKNPSDEESWEDFRRTYAPYVSGVLRRMNLNMSDREDLLQDVMLICWRKLPELDYDPEKGRLRGWLAIVARNEALRFLKKATRLPMQGGDSLLQLPQESELVALAEKEWRRFVSKLAWDNISPQFSENVLNAFQALAAGEDVEEIAQRLELSASSIYVYKKRVLNCLQKEILRLNQELL